MNVFPFTIGPVEYLHNMMSTVRITVSIFFDVFF